MCQQSVLQLVEVAEATAIATAVTAAALQQIAVTAAAAILNSSTSSSTTNHSDSSSIMTSGTDTISRYDSVALADQQHLTDVVA
jgi:hypothetical protein